MGAVPSIPTDKSRKVQVICAGYSRTGTSTMAVAISKLLDGPFCHGGTQIIHREDAYCKKWVQAYEAKKKGDKERLLKLLREVTAGFVGVGDMPNLDFIPELMEIYPDAKVVLVERDPERWLESVQFIQRVVTKPWLRYFVWVVPGWRWFPALIRNFGEAAMRLGAIEPKEPVKASLRLIVNWNNMVKDTVPPKKLLVMQLKDGWDPLCKYLGVPVPDEPFPRVNDAEAVEKFSSDITLRLVQIWGTALCTTAVVGFGVWRKWNV